MFSFTETISSTSHEKCNIIQVDEDFSPLGMKCINECYIIHELPLIELANIYIGEESVSEHIVTQNSHYT